MTFEEGDTTDKKNMYGGSYRKKRVSHRNKSKKTNNKKKLKKTKRKLL